MYINILEILFGLSLLFFGGEFVVSSAVAMAKRIGVSSFLIGLTVVAFGTSSPELFISVQAALDNYSDIALGNVIGSNIGNFLIVLGLPALIYPIHFNRKEILRDNIIVSFGSVSLLVIALFGLYLNGIENMYINRYFGLGFLLFITFYVFYIFKTADKKTEEQYKEQLNEIEPDPNLNKVTGWKQWAYPHCLIKANENLFYAIGFLLFGVFLLVKGSNYLVDGSVQIAQYYGISEAVIGVTLVAFGGSAPEFFTSVIAAWRKQCDIVIGNVLGSNLFNVFAILGITSLINPININQQFLYFDIPVLIICSLILLIIVVFKNVVSRLTGAIFCLAYAAYLFKLFLG